MASKTTAAPAVELRGVMKAFGPLVANRDVSFCVAPGTIHAVVGENGAGKSTCMKMLYGLYRPDAGEVLVHGEVRTWRTPRDAIAAGLGMVHQHFMLAGPYSGLDNIVLGAEPSAAGVRGGGWLPPPLRPIDRAGARRRLLELAEAYHFQVDLDSPVEALPVGVQQRLEILKLLYRDVNILILDEPTAVLTPQEVDEFFGNLRRLKAEGKTVLVITHKLGEVLRFADAVTVLRRGTVVASRPLGATLGAAPMTEMELAALMVGRSVHLRAEAAPATRTGASALTLQDVGLAARHGGGKPRLADLSFEVRSGEIVGIAGIEGNGQSDLLGLLLDPQAHFAGGRWPFGGAGLAVGALSILGQPATALKPQAVRDLGVGVIPEDRLRQGLIVGFDLTRNFLLGLQRTPEFARAGLIRRRRLAALTGAAIQAFDIRPTAPQALAGGLSGGNQQKLIVARELERRPRLLLCAQPTRGVDVGSVEFIHQRLIAARDGGAGVLLISSELDEITALADRILVIYEGRIAAQFRRGEATHATIGRFMGGARG